MRSGRKVGACRADGGGASGLLIETRHVKAALKAMTVKSDRNDARGIADAHGVVPSDARQKVPAQEIRALLTGRKLLLCKLRDVELGIRVLLRGFGLKVGRVSKGRYEACTRELTEGASGARASRDGDAPGTGEPASRVRQTASDVLGHRAH
jgi:hypothetical protein